MSKLCVTGLVLLSAGWAALAGGLRDNEAVIGGGSSSADGFKISGPSLCLRRGLPGIVTGAVQHPGQDRRYAYVLVIKGDEGRRLPAGTGGGSQVSGSAAASNGHVEIGGKKVAFRYSAGTDPAGAETLTVNGTGLDVAKGRVVLVDLSGEAATWQQIRAALPGPPPWPTTTEQVEAEARDVLQHLRRAGGEVEKFLK